MISTSLLVVLLEKYNTLGNQKGYAIAITFLETVAGVIIFFVLLYFYYLLKAKEIHFFKIPLYFKKMSYERQTILKNEFPFYNKLSTDKQKLFQKNVNHFLINKRFKSENDLLITEEMKVLIAATAIQILFGLEAYYLSHFDVIYITDNKDLQLKELRKSETIVIPWEAFKNGFSSLEDGYNPGLKIMAMCLSLEHELNQESKYMFNRSSFKKFQSLYKAQAEKYILSGKSKYNSYNQVDRSEYFAVAIEYFFERPEHFNANQPEMYAALSKLLRQDPLGMYKYK